jgi:hypothetical protein
MKIRFAHLILIIPLVLGSHLSAQTEAFCDRLENLMVQAGDGVTTSFHLSSRALAQVDCAPSHGLGGTVALHCAWPFEYRSMQALDAFDYLLGQVAACANPIAADLSSVSHPDSYDLRQFSSGMGVISVSLKDKGALNQTYVFLRVERPLTP